MKKLYILFVLVNCCTIFSHAQFLMKSNTHLLKPGDEHYFNITNNVDPGANGPSIIWDFSDLSNKSTLTSYMYSAYTTPNTNDIPEADAVLEEFDTKFYFKVSDNIIEQYGTVTKNNTVTRYDKPFVKMIFPFNFGDTYSGNYSGAVVGANNYKSAIQGTYSLEADAYGTLILPGNVSLKNVIRVKTIKEHCNNTGTCNFSTISYKWYSQEVRYPLLTIIQNKTSKGIKTIRTAYYSRAQNIYKKNTESNRLFSESIDAKIYPNPFKEEFKMEYTLTGDSDLLIEFFDNTGKKVYSIQNQNQKAGYYSKTINSEKLGNQLGMFHIRITAGEETVSKTLIRGE